MQKRVLCLEIKCVHCLTFVPPESKEPILKPVLSLKLLKSANLQLIKSLLLFLDFDSPPLMKLLESVDWECGDLMERS